jgi:chaperonin GroEL
MYIKRGIDKAVEAVVAELKKLSKDVKDNEGDRAGRHDLANGDSSIGKIIAECMEQVGKDGTITVEEAARSRPRRTSSRACSSTRATSRPTS